MQCLTLRWLLVQGGKKAIKDTFEKNEEKKREKQWGNLNMD